MAKKVAGKDVTRTEVPKESRAKNSSVGGHPRRNRHAMLDAGQAQARQDPGRPLGAQRIRFKCLCPERQPNKGKGNAVTGDCKDHLGKNGLCKTETHTVEAGGFEAVGYGRVWNLG